MKLSEILEACHLPEEFATLQKQNVNRARELESEVERLRTERDFVRQLYDLWRDQAKEYATSRDAYRAAVAELRQYVSVFENNLLAADVLQILDEHKLP